MTKAKRKASSFPPSFQKLFLHVANTGESVIVNNLENRRAAYVTLRARLNEFRKTYHEEALATADSVRIGIAEQMYAVTLRNPVQVDGKWQLEICIKEFVYEEKLQELLPETEHQSQSIDPEHEHLSIDAGAKSIADLMNEEDHK